MELIFYLFIYFLETNLIFVNQLCACMCVGKEGGGQKTKTKKTRGFSPNPPLDVKAR